MQKQHQYGVAISQPSEKIWRKIVRKYQYIFVNGWKLTHIHGRMRSLNCSNVNTLLLDELVTRAIRSYSGRQLLGKWRLAWAPPEKNRVGKKPSFFRYLNFQQGYNRIRNQIFCIALLYFYCCVVLVVVLLNLFGDFHQSWSGSRWIFNIATFPAPQCIIKQ